MAVLERFLNSWRQQQEFADAALGGRPASGGGGHRSGELPWVAPLLFVLLQSPLNGEATYGSKLLLRLCRIVAVTLPAAERLPVRTALQVALAKLPTDVLAARCVRPVLRYIESCVAAGLRATRLQARRRSSGALAVVHGVRTERPLGCQQATVPCLCRC